MKVALRLVTNFPKEKNNWFEGKEVYAHTKGLLLFVGKSSLPIPSLFLTPFWKIPFILTPSFSTIHIKKALILEKKNPVPSFPLLFPKKKHHSIPLFQLFPSFPFPSHTFPMKRIGPPLRELLWFRSPHWKAGQYSPYESPMREETNHQILASTFQAQWKEICRSHGLRISYLEEHHSEPFGTLFLASQQDVF